MSTKYKVLDRMITFFIITISLIAIFVLWNLASKRYVIPCPSYLAWIVEIDNPFAKENQSSSIISHLELKEGMHIADIGCGPGRISAPLSYTLLANSHLLAVDIQASMLEKAKQKLHVSQNIEFRQGSLGEGILEKNTYDYILLVNVLGEIPNQSKALQEAFKALKPGGILSITETIFDPHYQRLKSLEKMMQSVGFQKKQVYGKWYSYTAHFVAKKT